MDSLEVRCCCDAGKIMGCKVFAGRADTALLQPHEHLKFETPMGTVDLEVHPVHTLVDTMRGQTRFALRSNDYPMEQLKQVPGFVPNPEVL